MRTSNLAGIIGLTSLALTAATGAAHAAGNPCSPLTYGAVGDGQVGTNNGTDNTTAIQTAINNCAAAGGGIVSLSPVAGGKNIYKTSPILLASHVLLQINTGVTLLGTTDHTQWHIAYLDYPAPGTGSFPFQPTRPYEALIFAYQAVDTGIIGGGTINGQGNVNAADGGSSWWNLPSPGTGATVNGTPWYKAPYTDIPTSNGTPRPWLVEFYQCNNVTVNGITLVDSPMWTMVLRYSSNITVSNYHVQNYSDANATIPSGTGPNTDGIDIVGSDHVTMTGLNVQNGDDDVAIKSGLPVDVVSGVQGSPGSDANEVGLPQLPAHDLVISNSNLTGGHGLSIGSEASNGAYNVMVQNIHSVGPALQVGFRIKTGRTRGNYAVGIHDVTLQNMTVTNVALPITIYDYYPASDGPVETTPASFDPPQQIQQYTPNVYNINISGFTATGATSESLIVGVPEACILNVNMNNVNITTSNSTAGFQLRNMTGTFTNVNITDTHAASPQWAVQENVQVTASGTPGLTSPVNTPPLTTTPPGAPCGRYALGTTP